MSAFFQPVQSQVNNSIDPTAIGLRNAPGEFTFRVNTGYTSGATSTALSGSYNVNNQIAKQTLFLTQVRVEFDDAANALGCRSLSIRFPFISIFHVLDAVDDKFDVIVPLDESKVTYAVGLRKPYTMSSNVHDAFNYLVTPTDGSSTNFGGLRSVTLQFEFDYSYTS